MVQDRGQGEVTLTLTLTLSYGVGQGTVQYWDRDGWNFV